MNIGDEVAIKGYNGSAWKWPDPQRLGHITDVDKHCYGVRTDDGENIRDVHEHFRAPAEDSHK